MRSPDTVPKKMQSFFEGEPQKSPRTLPLAPSPSPNYTHPKPQALDLKSHARASQFPATRQVERLGGQRDTVVKDGGFGVRIEGIGIFVKASSAPRTNFLVEDCGADTPKLQNIQQLQN